MIRDKGKLRRRAKEYLRVTKLIDAIYNSRIG